MRKLSGHQPSCKQRPVCAAVNVLPVGYEVSELRAEFRLAAKMGDTLYIRTARDDEHFYVVLTDADENPYFLCEFSGIVKA